MPARKPRTPAYRLNKTTNRAVVTIAGRDYWLGRYGSAESHAEYRRLIAEWLAGNQIAPPPARGGSGSHPELTVTELILAYYRHAEGYYVKHGKPTAEVVNIRLALREMRRLYGHTPAAEFGPLGLKAVREAMIEAGLSRGVINRRVRMIVRAFRWATENELVPPSVHHGLKAVTGLRRGRTAARDTEPVKPVPDAQVDAVRPFLSRQIWTAIEIQRLTGMRPGEVVIMRTGDIDRAGPVWVYRPSSHKAEHHGRERLVFLGPRAQEVVKPWLRADPDAFLFSPAESMAEFHAGQRSRRRTPVQPSQRDRTRPAPRKRPGERYTAASYCRAIEKACRKAWPHPTLSALPRRKLTPEQRAELIAWEREHRWHANQLRHSAGTEIRRRFGLEAAQVILGHAKADVTQVYAEADAQAAMEVVRKIG